MAFSKEPVLDWFCGDKKGFRLRLYLRHFKQLPHIILSNQLINLTGSTTKGLTRQRTLANVNFSKDARVSTSLFAHIQSNMIIVATTNSVTVASTLSLLNHYYNHSLCAPNWCTKGNTTQMSQVEVS